MLARGTVVALVAMLLASRAFAQPGPSPTEVRAARLDAATVVRLVTDWDPRSRSPGTRLLVDGVAAPVPLAGASSVGTVTVGHGIAVAAVMAPPPAGAFSLRVVRRQGDEVTVGRAIGVDRPLGDVGTPFSVAATSTPEGFAVFFQELSVTDPTDAHTFLARLSAEGIPTGPAVAVAVPWSLAATTWNGHGFHLALVYPGDPHGMRLSMVSLAPDGRPEQHPDWASAPGFLADVHLVHEGDRILASYRGGPGGDRWLEGDVTAIRSWGSEPPPARDRGALPPSDVLVEAETASALRPAMALPRR